MRWLLLLAWLLLLVACAREVEPDLRGEVPVLARVTVTGTGLFKVEPAALDALRWRATDPLALTMNDEPWPYQVHEGVLYFYLPESVHNRYSSQHTLWLTMGAAPTLSPAPTPASQEPPRLIAEQRLTANEQYNPKYIGDPWFWRTLFPTETDRHEIATPGRETGAVSVTLRVAGVTQTEHKITLDMAGRSAGVLRWDGDERHDETLSIDLSAGDSLTLDLSVPEAESEGPLDISLLDEIVIRYPSTLQMNDGIFRGVAEKGGHIPVASLGEEIIAWQLEPLRPLPIKQGVLAVPENVPLVILERALAQPAALEGARSAIKSPLSTRGAGADYVVIVAPSLADAVEPLLAYHRAAGLRVVVFRPQRLYDSYSAGTVDPLAIRAFLREANDHWEMKPRFVLLVGDSTYDPAGYQSELPPAYLPSPFVETVFGGETVSDNALADLDEDGYPDLALGRIPARSPEQLAVMVQKLLAYTQTPASGPWRERVLLIADGQEALFQQNSERVRAALPVTVESVTVYPAAQSAASAQLLPRLNEGNLLVNYVGHGSVQQWGKDAFLTVETMGEMHNGQRLPLVINMTCLVGLFSHPTQDSLAESLLWAEDGGAIAVIAPSSLTLPSDQSLLNQALLAELLSPERPPIGEALMRAKQTVALDSANAHDILATFNLLGDPALRLVEPGQ
ncbi:MAG: hypothetical protein H0T73_11630 [Ardenticatenales bacterium]|nr:hypothetical protein [Ardenticatenales bacterium]